MALFSSRQEQEPLVFHNYSESYNDSDDALSSAMDSVDESNPTKRRKIGDPILHPHPNQTHIPPIQWRSHTQQTIYSSKLVQALRQVLRRNTTQLRAGRDVRDTADRVLAVTAKGRTRWSRAILANSLGGSRFRCVNKHKKVKKMTAYGPLKSKRTGLSEDTRKRRRRKVQDWDRRRSSAVRLQSQVRVLSKLVPGCRKVCLPNLLEEATDYIAALEMQVQSMKVIADLLAGVMPADRVNRPIL